VPNNHDVLLTLDEVGELLGTGPGLPARLVAQGLLDHVTQGRRVLIPHTAVIAYAVNIALRREVFGNDRAL
jgi:excisionase family DNA binding protein